MKSLIITNCLIFITLNCLLTFTTGLLKLHPDQDKRTPDFITSYGYPLEHHKIITQDGYILTYFRIPYGRKSPRSPYKKKPPVLLEHGILLSSGTWFIQPKETMFPFMLADAGYDVWLGNARGTTYSTGHINPLYDSSNPINHYWNYSWEEIGIYDTTAAIDYILKRTRHKNLFYIGHSQGTTQILVLLALRPEYNAKIKLVVLYSPVAFFGYIKSVFKVVGPVAKLKAVAGVNRITSAFGIGQFIPNAFLEIGYKLGPGVCSVPLIEYTICSTVMFLLFGFDKEQTSLETILPVYLSQLPDTTSVMSVLHYGQLMSPISHEFNFNRFDHGIHKNLELYGSFSPPAYNLSAITAPVALFYGNNDFLAEPEDVEHLRQRLPNVVKYYQVPWRNWNHMDFLHAKNASQFVYKPTMAFMRRFL